MSNSGMNVIRIRAGKFANIIYDARETLSRRKSVSLLQTNVESLVERIEFEELHVLDIPARYLKGMSPQTLTSQIMFQPQTYNPWGSDFTPCMLAVLARRVLNWNL